MPFLVLRFDQGSILNMSKQPKTSGNMFTGKSEVALRSQIVTSKRGRGGRQYAPWVFTEHGVVMAATILNSKQAIEASKLVVDVFIEVKRSLDGQDSALKVISKDTPDGGSKGLARLDGFWNNMGPRLQAAMDQVLDSVIDQKRKSTIREEAQNLISESINTLKDRLKKTGLENEELAAKATKLLAEAEKEKSIAAKTRAETEAVEFQTIVKKLRLLIEAQRAMTQNKVDGFLNVLKELGE